MDNIAIGHDAGSALASGIKNTFLGSSVATTVLGDQNICIGYLAGTGGTDLTTGDYNVLIGNQSGTNAADAQNRVAIGYGCEAVADNSVTLGNADVDHVYMAQDSGAEVHAALYKSIREGNSYSFWGINEDSTITSNNIFIDLDYANDDDGTGAYFVRMQDSGGEIGSIKVASASGVSFNTSSDYRLKENEVLITDGLDMVNNLKPYRFNFKGYQDRVIDGFFAHEVEPYVPTAVSGEKDAVREDGSILPQSMDYGQMVTVMVAAIQELSAKVEELEAKLK
jgi:hypothetical protein